MAWTAPRTWVTGEVLTSTLLNTHVRDNLIYLHDNPPYKTLDSAVVASSTAGWGGEANLIVGNAVVYDGRPLIIQFEAAQVIPNGNSVVVRVYEDATLLEAVCQCVATTNNAPGWPLAGSVDRTPAAGTHTYKATAFASAGSVAAAYTNIKLRVKATSY